MTANYNYLTWIDDDSLYSAINDIYQVYQKALNRTKLDQFERNIIDPFLTFFEISFVDNFNIQKWLNKEVDRQINKTLSNSIGDFHQKILGSSKGWINLGHNHETGLDIRNEDQTIWAELKNRDGTITGSNRDSVFNKLAAVADQYQNATVYLVHIIRTKNQPYDQEWSFKAKSKNYHHPRVREISGDLFYDKVAETKGALKQLFEILPTAINKCLEKNVTEKKQLEIEQELKEKLGKESFSSDDLFIYFFNQAYRGYNDDQ